MFNEQPVQVDYEDDNFLIRVPYRFNVLVQGLPDRRFRSRLKDWVCPGNWRVVHMLDTILQENPPSSISESAKEAMVRLRRGQGNNDSSYPKDFPFKYPPFVHQREAYENAYPLDAYALFFEQGLGKTKTALDLNQMWFCLLYTSPSPRDLSTSRMPSSA